MNLLFDEYKNKVRGCWMGKNIGGVLGAPLEAKRGVFDYNTYLQEDLINHPQPNDDLDLQLVWLAAVEKYGRQVNASILGEYWLHYILPNWAEYGSGKNNLRMGLLPPLSGYDNNIYRDSCGCFIRSEIWACLAPGHPDLAVHYAYEDAIVDHSTEGMYGEIFCAAVQSAAFAEQDRFKLIDIGLSYIPAESDLAKAIRLAIQCYQSGVDWKEARIKILSAVPGTFGVQNMKVKDAPTDLPYGQSGYDAPGNVGIMVMAWLYGENDFGKSLNIANNCGEDTDCTCATLGAVLGIMNGYDSIPQEWISPIGDGIATCCINRLDGGIPIANTVTELTDQILNVTPSFLGRSFCDLLTKDGYTITMKQGEALYYTRDEYQPDINCDGAVRHKQFHEIIASPFVVNYKFVTFECDVDYMDVPYIRVNEARKIKLTFRDAVIKNHNQQWLTLKWYLPDGVQILPCNQVSFPLQSLYESKTEFEFEILCESFSNPKVELIADITVNGHHSQNLLKVVLLPAC